MSLHRVGLDAILLNDIRAQASIGPDRWGKVRLQPITLSLRVYASLIKPGQTDDVTDSVHYGDLTKRVVKRVDGTAFTTLLSLAEAVAAIALEMDTCISAIEVNADAYNQFLLAKSLGAFLFTSRALPAAAELNGVVPSEEYVNCAYIRDLSVATVIGVNPPERVDKQVVIVNTTFHGCDWTKLDWRAIHSILVKEIDNTSYLTLEAFVLHVVRVLCHLDGADVVTVSAQKPSALTVAHSSGVEITRKRSFFVSPQ